MGNVKFDEKFDCIVIGEGPAGVSAAIACAQKGLKVLVIGDNRAFNSCEIIESYSPAIVSLFNELGISFDTDSRQCIGGKFSFISDGIDFKSLNPYTDQIWDGFHVYKQCFYKFLINQIIIKEIPFVRDFVSRIIYSSNRIAGVETNTKKIFYANYLIDGTGNNRLLGRRMKFRNSIYSTSYYVESGISSEFKDFNMNLDFAYLLPKKEGWKWLAPLHNGLYGWTELFSYESLDANKKKRVKKKEVKTANMRWRIFRPVCKEGVLLCGDAAYLLDPASGQGVLNAIRHGIKAATVVYNAKMNPDLESFLLASYDNDLLIEFEEKVNQLRQAYEWIKPKS